MNTMDVSFVSILLFLSLILCFLVFFMLLRSYLGHSLKAAKSKIFAILIMFCGLLSIFITNDFIIFSVSSFLVSAFLLGICYFDFFTSKKISDELPETFSEKLKNIFSFKKIQSLDSNELNFEVNESVSIETEENVPKKIVDLCYKFFLSASETFNKKIEVSEFLDQVNSSIIEELNADGGVVLLVDDFEDILVVKSLIGDFPPPYKLPSDLPHKQTRVVTNFKYAQFDFENNIFGFVAKSGKPELIANPCVDNRIFQNEPEDFLMLGTYIFVPMVLDDTVIGVLALARKKTSIPFNYDDFDKALILANFVTASVKGIYSFKEVSEQVDLHKEAVIAEKIQNAMLLRVPPHISGLSFGFFFNEAKGICGDYYDIIPSRKDRLSLVVADVAGKGIDSLIVMIMLRAILRLVVNTMQSAATILDWVNRGITGKITIDHFASLSLAIYNQETKTIQFATAGTNFLYIWRDSEQRLEKISVVSDPIGVEKTTTYTEMNLNVSQGDIIIMYTDGLVEAIDKTGHQYGMQHIETILKENKNLNAQEIADRVKADVKDFCGSSNQHDDQTLLIMKIQD